MNKASAQENGMDYNREVTVFMESLATDHYVLQRTDLDDEA